ncbi:MAG: hypothetical protein GY811_20160 [Myxococcales bacterium]|nr:hypothetical protein [Myxococcales bacterium]
MYFGPHFSEISIDLNSNGNYELKAPTNSVDGVTTCTDSLNDNEQQAFSTKFGALDLFGFPDTMEASFVRDGTKLILQAKCGNHGVRFKAFNIFSDPIGDLLDGGRVAPGRYLPGAPTDSVRAELPHTAPRIRSSLHDEDGVDRSGLSIQSPVTPSWIVSGGSNESFSKTLERDQ